MMCTLPLNLCFAARCPKRFPRRQTKKTDDAFLFQQERPGRHSSGPVRHRPFSTAAAAPQHLIFRNTAATSLS